MPETTEEILEKRPPIVFGVCWWNHRTIRGLLAYSPEPPLLCRTFERALDEAIQRRGCLIGWASRLSDQADSDCHTAGVPLIRIEDGFLRSVGLGAGLAPAASLVLDHRGIYYDGTRPSDLEQILESVNLDDGERARGNALRRKIIRARISKYNLGKALKQNRFPLNRRKVLVPGQVSDDAAILKTHCDSIDLANADNVNVELLKVARRNNPDAYIIYKPHPDVSSGLRKGAVDRSEMLRYVDAVIEDVDIIDLIEQCDQVETMTSLSGFEALLRGKDVVVHGLPFYAGWGLTRDFTISPRRTRLRSIDELIYLALIRYSRYVDPSTFRLCEPESLIDALQQLRQSPRHRINNAIRLRLAWVGDRLNPHT